MGLLTDKEGEEREGEGVEEIACHDSYCIIWLHLALRYCQQG